MTRWDRIVGGGRQTLVFGVPVALREDVTGPSQKPQSKQRKDSSGRK